MTTEPHESELHIEDDGTIVEVVDPTGQDCGCVIRRYPDGTWTDSGCFRHMPHDSGEGEARAKALEALDIDTWTTERPGWLDGYLAVRGRYVRVGAATLAEVYRSEEDEVAEMLGANLGPFMNASRTVEEAYATWWDHRAT